MSRNARLGLALVGALAMGACAQSLATTDDATDRDPTIPALETGKGGGDPAMPATSPTMPPAAPDAGPADTGAPPPRDAAADTAPVDAGPPAPPLPKQGEVLVTEVMYDTFGSEPDGEWIELHNTTTGARTLNGLTIKDGGGRTHKIPASPAVTLAPGEYRLLVRSRTGAVAAKVPAGAILYEYGLGLPSNAGILLANGATGGVTLVDGATEIARAEYGGWFSQSGGSSVQLKTLSYAASGAASGWCLSLNAWTTGSEKGTPGAASDCP